MDVPSGYEGDDETDAATDGAAGAAAGTGAGKKREDYVCPPVELSRAGKLRLLAGVTWDGPPPALNDAQDVFDVLSGDERSAVALRFGLAPGADSHNVQGIVRRMGTTKKNVEQYLDDGFQAMRRAAAILRAGQTTPPAAEQAAVPAAERVSESPDES